MAQPLCVCVCEHVCAQAHCVCGPVCVTRTSARVCICLCMFACVHMCVQCMRAWVGVGVSGSVTLLPSGSPGNGSPFCAGPALPQWSVQSVFPAWPVTSEATVLRNHQPLPRFL